MKIPHILYGLLLLSSLSYANDSVTLHSDTGDTLMIHQLKNGELWGSFMVTDQVADSFAEHELILMQIDQQQPINLEGKRSCGGAAGKPQTVDYQFEDTQQDWLFNGAVSTQSDVFEVLGWDEPKKYKTLNSDRRYEVVDFPIQASVGLPELLQQFRLAQEIMFRYSTQGNEQRFAVFNMREGNNVDLDDLLNRKKAP